MNTPTHLLIGAAVLARPGAQDGGAPHHRWRNAAILAGALAPDLALFAMFAWMRGVAGVSEETLWREVYWREHWQTVFALGNAVALYGLIAVAGWLVRDRAVGRLAMIFAVAALLHLAFDLPFHHDDAHRHFWPLSDWRFHSPLSYWDTAHHGDIVGYLETAMALVLIIVLWRRFPENPWVKAALGIAGLSYVAVPLYFTLMLGG